LGIPPSSLAVAGLLVAAVPPVFRVDEHVQAQAAGHLHGAVGAGIVHQDDVVDVLQGQVAPGLLQRLLGVVGWHDDAHLELAVGVDGGRSGLPFGKILRRHGL
jgi:hypothetical protein